MLQPVETPESRLSTQPYTDNVLRRGFEKNQENMLASNFSMLANCFMLLLLSQAKKVKECLTLGLLTGCLVRERHLKDLLVLRLAGLGHGC